MNIGPSKRRITDLKIAVDDDDRKHTHPLIPLVNVFARGEKHVIKAINFAFSLNAAHLVTSTPITAKSHA